MTVPWNLPDGPVGPDLVGGFDESPVVPCRFCGAQFGAAAEMCPRCGLSRTAQVPGAAPAVDSAPNPYAYLPPSEPAPSPRRLSRRWVAVAVGFLALVVVSAVLAVTDTGSGGNAAATVTVPGGPGVVFRSSAGHFAARFPEDPDVRTIPESIADLHITILVAADVQSHTLVESDEFSQSVPSGEVTALLTSAIRSAASSGQVTLVSDSATTFQGRPAHQGSFVGTDGTSLSAVAFAYGNRRFYEILAPTGSAFNELTASFVAVP